MLKLLIILGSIFAVLALLYWWFVPWRPVIRPFEISGLKEANPGSSPLIKKGQRVLAITGHVDDLEFFCGGTMGRLQEQEAKTWLVVGTEDYTWYYATRKTAEDKTKKRKQEQDKVADYFNYQKVIYLGYPDFRLQADSESLEKIEKIIKEFKPDAILTFDPVNGQPVQHHDHTAAGIIALEATKKSGTDAEIFMFATGKPNSYVDVTDTINRKWTALRMYNSVFPPGNPMFGRLKQWAKDAGRKAGTDYAESYHVVQF